MLHQKYTIWLFAISCTIISFLAVHRSEAISSPIPPYTNYTYSTELQPNVADLWWNVNETSQNIIFELHVHTVGWITLGISPGMHLSFLEPLSLHHLFFSISWWNERC